MECKIVGYGIVTAADPAGLKAGVEHQMQAEGVQPLGGATQVMLPRDGKLVPVFMQTIVKYESLIRRLDS